MQLPGSAKATNVAYFANHPKQVEKRIHEVATDSSKVYLSAEVNDLATARGIQSRTILRCLKEGTVDSNSIKAGGQNVQGIISAIVCGAQVDVEFFLGPETSGLTVVNAYADDEE